MNMTNHRNPPTLYHVPKTISSPIVQILYELNAVSSSSSSSSASSLSASSLSASGNGNGNGDDNGNGNIDNTNDGNGGSSGNGRVNIEILTFAELKSSKHLKRNPMGTSPTFTDEINNISIWESGAVLTYILDMYDTNYTLHPPPPPPPTLSSPASSSSTSSSTSVSSSTPQHQRAKFLHLQQYIIATVYPFLSSLYIHTLKPKIEQDENYIINSKDKWMTLLAPTLLQFLDNDNNDDNGDDDGDNDNNNNNKSSNNINNNNDFIYFMGRNNISAIDYLICKPLGNAYSLGILSDNDKQFPKLYSIYKKIKCMSSYNLAYNSNNYKNNISNNNNNNNSNNNNLMTTTTATTTTINKKKDGEFRSMVLIPGK